MGRYATRINGVTDFVITKLDVLTGLETIPVCVAYDVDGTRHDEMPVNQTDFHHATPVYEELEGWREDISGCRKFEERRPPPRPTSCGSRSSSAPGCPRSGSAPAATRSSAGTRSSVAEPDRGGWTCVTEAPR